MNAQDVRRLNPGDYGKSRALWEEIFPDDTKEFLDYYYEYCTRENLIYGIMDDKSRLLSMAQFNPYKVHLGDARVDTHYIVAVATRPESRHQGMMRQILHQALRDGYDRNEPFMFLMPAAEAIYKPFDFETVYGQKSMTVHITKCSGKNKRKEIQIQEAREEDLSRLADLSETLLGARYQVYTVRTEDYMKRLQKEQESEQGGILLFLADGRPVGYCFSAMEETPQIRELVCEPEYEDAVMPALFSYYKEKGSFESGQDEAITVTAFGDHFPELFQEESEEEACKAEMASWIMVRIIHLESFASCLRSREPVSFTIRTEDRILPGNQGVFRFELDEHRGCAQPVPDCRAEEIDAVLSVAELTRLFFGVYDGKEADRLPLSKIHLFDPVFLDEIV